MEEEENEENIFIKERKRLRIKYTFITIILVLIVAVFSSEFTLFYYNGVVIPEKEEASEDSDATISAIAQTLKSFREVIDQVYIGEIDETQMLEETIKGYINGLGDEYSEYMTAEEWEDFQTSALGNYVGIGIYMSIDKNDNVIVLAPIEGTPAEEAGLEQGDVIVAVDDENALGLSSEDVSNMIKGEEGTNVKITVLRGTEYIDFNITRASIKVYHVEEEMLENNIGYISLLTFDEGCSDEFKEAIETLQAEGAEKLIIDLRNNTGGLVNEALSIADMIVSKGATTLITVDSSGNKEYSTSENDPIVDCEIVVLVNEYSASASEILVGALKDNGCAKIVGTTTYGKGVIQSVYQLTDGSALKLTVNEYYTPNETKINKVGIEPDVVVEYDEETEDDEQLNAAIDLLK